jgi:hypothetical protein
MFPECSLATLSALAAQVFVLVGDTGIEPVASTVSR